MNTKFSPLKSSQRYQSPNIPMSAIRRYARQVVEKFQPEKVILFGAFARGDQREGSDVDLLVVKPARNEISKASRIRASRPLLRRIEGATRMATRTTILKQKRRSQTADSELAHLRAEVARLRAQVRALKTEKLSPFQADALPALPTPNANGNLPGEETMDAIIARQIIRRRHAAGWSQAELAAQAGVRQETVSRLESCKHAPNVATVDKLDRALRAAGV